MEIIVINKKENGNYGDFKTSESKLKSKGIIKNNEINKDNQY